MAAPQTPPTMIQEGCWLCGCCSLHLPTPPPTRDKHASPVGVAWRGGDLACPPSAATTTKRDEWCWRACGSQREAPPSPTRMQDRLGWHGCGWAYRTPTSTTTKQDELRWRSSGLPRHSPLPRPTSKLERWGWRGCASECHPPTPHKRTHFASDARRMVPARIWLIEAPTTTTGK